MQNCASRLRGRWISGFIALRTEKFGLMNETEAEECCLAWMYWCRLIGGTSVVNVAQFVKWWREDPQFYVGMVYQHD